MKNLKYLSITLIIVVLAVPVGGCTEEEEPPDQVTVQLKWIHQAQAAGLYVADQKGFYAEENIDVEFKPGGPGISIDMVIAELIGGESTFAIRGGDEFLQARAEGKPIVAIAVIYQRNPWVYMSMQATEIKQPQDLVGKRLMVAPQAGIQHTAFLDKVGIDPSSIEIVPDYERGVTRLTSGQIDVQLSVGVGPRLEFEEAGYELNYIWVEEYGIPFYADTIAATEQLIQQDPELVERFLRATLKGWRYAIENPNEAVDMTLQYDTTLDRDHQVGMMAAHTPIIHTGKAEIGWMEDKVWQEMHQMLLNGGVLTQPINVADAYTMEFLEKIYSKER